MDHAEVPIAERSAVRSRELSRSDKYAGVAPELPIGSTDLWHAGSVDGTYDAQHDLAYLRLIPTIEAGSSKRQIVFRNDALADEFVLDLDEDGRILGIEVFTAGAVLRPETIAQLRHLGAP